MLGNNPPLGAVSALPGRAGRDADGALQR